MYQPEYLESVLVEKSTIPGQLIGFVTDIKLCFNLEIEYYGLYREEKSRFYRKIKIIKNS